MESKTEINETAPASSIAKGPYLRLQIELRAYYLWLQDGGRYDNRLIHLLRAEREIMNGYPQQ